MHTERDIYIYFHTFTSLSFLEALQTKLKKTVTLEAAVLSLRRRASAHRESTLDKDQESVWTPEDHAGGGGEKWKTMGKTIWNMEKSTIGKWMKMMHRKIEKIDIVGDIKIMMNGEVEKNNI